MSSPFMNCWGTGVGGEYFQAALEARERAASGTVSHPQSPRKTENIEKQKAPVTKQSLLKVAAPIAERWSDENIMDGLFEIDVGMMKKSDAPSALAARMLKAGYKSSEEQELRTNKQSVRTLSAADGLKLATNIVAEHGFGYAPQNRGAKGSLRKDMIKMIKATGDVKDVSCAVAKANAFSTSRDTACDFHVFLFANKKTSAFVEIFVRDGGE